ncbi:hypothetical protein FSP39_014625 [Pinctada imbricata]|uniref:poly(A)-specific ribonuclease n=1 Tax=Pinctada imbricata TaxID=66713 RepID=A0AA88XSE9_PINIB|nr:hypothetical protein FSP39_014625 [Pinctada imbricata]
MELLVDGEERVVVKREEVSVTNAGYMDFKDIPTAQNAMFRLNPTSSCKKCLKVRHGRNGKWRQKNTRTKPSKANTPIVIQLKDTLKAALKQKQRSLIETVQKSKTKDVSSGDTVQTTEIGSTSDDKVSNKGNRTKRDVKNLSALISVIEKKENKVSGSNLSKNIQSMNSKFVANYVLNNSTYSTEYSEPISKRSIVECENVDIICNDLNNSDKCSSQEDSESDNGSTVSSTEAHSDSDASMSVQPEATETEMSPEELEKLAEFTTGAPLIRYDCPPSECPQCLNELWAAQCYYGFQNYHVDNTNIDPNLGTTTATEENHTRPSESEIDDEESVNVYEDSEVFGDTAESANEFQNEEETQSAESTDSKISEESKQRHNSQRQLLEIDIAGRGGKPPPDPFHDSVYIDLTDTDVTFTVYYHHDTAAQDDVNVTYATATTHTYLPSAASYQMMAAYQATNSFVNLPYWYWPYVYPPMFTLPTPLYWPGDSPSIPKTLMIPPKELEKFNSTAPPLRHWMPLTQPERGKTSAIFTVMCYNVLCDKYCTRQIYGYCPSWALNWEYRKKGILEEIKHCSADIISLQEVETDQFHKFFLPELQRDGYDGIFSAKSRARTMNEADRKYVDGCAIFFKKSKFTLVKDHLIEFNQLAMANAEGSDDMLNRVMTKDNIGLAAMLETKEGAFESGVPPDGQVKQPVMVATAHIHWDPEFSDVKLIQTMMLMWKLQDIIKEDVHSFRPNSAGALDLNSIPFILCGDLNSLPESGVVEFLTSGKVARTHEDFKDISYEDAIQRINGSNDKECFTHEFQLNRAYDNDIMPFTNYTYDFKGIIDYIFFSKKHFNLLGLLGPLDQDWFRQNKVVGCPHPHVPSDHFPLLVEFEMPVQQSSINNSSNTQKHR